METPATGGVNGGGVEAAAAAGGAGSVLSMSPGSSLSVRYGSQFGPHDDLVLLEVDDGLLHEILHKGYRFSLPLPLSRRSSISFRLPSPATDPSGKWEMMIIGVVRSPTFQARGSIL